MNRHVIRTSETDSVKGIPSKQNIDVSLKQTTKMLPFPNISTTLSQRSVYEEERQAGNKFRLIVTIVPYCSNVLFNPLTEIIKDEGSEKPTVITDCTNMNGAPITDTQIIEDAYGEPSPTRVHMISNTEYSSEKHGGYKYHPGYDFFDNHILRNNTFKLVNTNIPDKSKIDRGVFNTLGDFARDRNGEYLKYVKRLSILSTNSQNFSKQHLYLADDILKIDESINQNLHEENGWWGFLNNSTIETKELNDKTRLWENIDISRVLNDGKPCEFIDMYPDRTLFSFSPKYNQFRHKQEYNWNVVITYPYKNVYTHPICLGGSSYIKRRLNNEGDYVEETVTEGNRWMGLKVMTAQLGQGKIGGNSVVFRTYTRHGLSQQDLVYIYYTNPFKETEEYCECEKFSEDSLNSSEKYYETENYYKVTNIGDLNRENNEYYFYISNVGFLKELYRSYMDYVHKLEKEGATDKIPFFNEYKKYKDAEDLKDIFDENNVLKSDLINKILKYTNFRIRRCVKGVKSTYYMRLFRKIPNLRAAQREMTEEESQHRSKFNGVFENYITENALDPNNPKYQRLVNNEQYQMAFASNIFNDNITQITFMDGIDTKGLCDNLGRPLSELYYTLVKNNAGHEAWYMEDKEVSGVPMYSTEDVRGNNEFIKKYGQDYTVEFSHCFGRVTSGLEMHFKKGDTEETTAPIDYLKKMSSANHISNIINDEINGLEADEISKNLDENINYKDTFFHGDLVEYNPFECEEHVLSNVMHRFNTAQRELIKNPLYSQYQYHEITEDDYDPYDFEVTEFSAVNGVVENRDGSMIKDWGVRSNDYSTIARPEGYIYKAHYKIPIREYTRLLQDSHYSLNIRSVKPVQKDGILLQVKTKLAHNLEPNEVIFICDDERDKRYITKCVKVIDKVTFLMSVDYSEIVVNATDFEDIEYLPNFNKTVYETEQKGNKNRNKYTERFSWLELCEILNGKFEDDINYPKLVLRRKNKDIPDYATYIGGNNYVWRNIVNIGDSTAREIPDYIFANGYFYVTNRINFYLKRQDPFGNNGLYFDGEDKYPYFPNDPSGIVQKENNYITKDTNVIC